MFSSPQTSASEAKPYRFVKLTVNGSEIKATNRVSHVEVPIMDVSVTIHSRDVKGSSSIKLHEINHTTATFFESTNEEYSVEIFFCKSKVTTTLPAEMSSNLINFFKLFKPTSKSKYSCINFAYEMAYGRGKIVNDSNPGNFDESSSSAFSEDKLIPGDIVRLNKADKFRHYAIFIGQNYYLSLFGKVGPLVISTLDVCKKSFDADRCVQVFKKKR